MSQLQPSRIAQHTSSDIQRTANKSKDASQINSTLLALGAPTISSDDFNRLYQGPFGELLLFMSTQIKGRRQVAKDRHLIQQLVTMLLSEPSPNAASVIGYALYRVAGCILRRFPVWL
ncbi:hypothetical protein H2248_011725 [Termitomyces sp. 'cryptogamus']|nr:hypothetical protein H2248_011725 [Termitomyces sp. 'cryptogamus']